MALPKPPNKRGRPLKKAKPTAAELAGIRKRSAASHGGKSRNEAAVLATWERNQQRKTVKKLQTTRTKRVNGREPNKVVDIAALRAGAKGRAPKPMTTPISGNARVNHSPVAGPGPVTMGKVRGKSALAPGRARGNPTPGVPRSASAPGRMPSKTPMEAGRGTTPKMPKPPKLGFDEGRGIRVELPKPRIKKRVGS